MSLLIKSSPAYIKTLDLEGTIPSLNEGGLCLQKTGTPARCMLCSDCVNKPESLYGVNGRKILT